MSPPPEREPGDLGAVPVSIVGTHGGAGTSTVARLLTATDLGRQWPEPSGGHPPQVLLVARTHASGLMSASQALAGYCATTHPDGPYLIGLVLIADAPGKLPKALKRRVRILASATTVFRLPWIASWRSSDTAYDARIAQDLRSFAEQAGRGLASLVTAEGERS
jgi:hypothetical protein